MSREKMVKTTEIMSSGWATCLFPVAAFFHAGCGAGGSRHFCGGGWVGGSWMSQPCELTPLQRQEGGDHYKHMKIQVVEFCHQNQIPFMEGQVIKYVCRWRKKGGLLDLKKAKHFIELIMQMEEEGQ